MLIAAGFLSEHMFPETDTRTAPVIFSMSLQTASEAIVAMFMPMASPVENENLRKRFLPSGNFSMRTSFPCDVVVLTATWIAFSLLSIQSMTWMQ